MPESLIDKVIFDIVSKNKSGMESRSVSSYRLNEKLALFFPALFTEAIILTLSPFNGYRGLKIISVTLIS